MKKRPYLNYRKLYLTEVRETKKVEQDAIFAMHMYIEQGRQIKEIKHNGEYLENQNKELKKSLDRANRLYIDTYNQLQEIDAKRIELVRENNLLHDTLKSYKIPLHRKTWAEIKHGIKTWVKQFDEK